MKYLPIILSSMAFTVCATAQSVSDFPAELEQAVVNYTYDASGNRIERSGKMAIIEIRAYPNPTTDILNVEVQGMEEGTLPATFTSLDGNRTMHLELEHVNRLDLGAYPRGWYMFNVETGNQSSQTFKILKR